MMLGFEFRSQVPLASRAGIVPNLKLAIDGDDCAATATDTLSNLGQRHTRGRKQQLNLAHLNIRQCTSLFRHWSASCVPSVYWIFESCNLRISVIKHRLLNFDSSPKVPHHKVPLLPAKEKGPIVDRFIEAWSTAASRVITNVYAIFTGALRFVIIFKPSSGECHTLLLTDIYINE